ncbi:MAG: M64 family metallopeptidase, partial [Paracoccaceae bacterium]|nr:M64 family metallopeptidase [Paracoccaceae bacterium]
MVKFTSADGIVFQNTIDLTLKDITNDKVTVTPTKVYKDVYGAKIANLSADWNFFSQIVMGSSGNKDSFFEIDKSGKALKLKDTYYFDGSTVKDGRGNSTPIANLVSIKLDILDGQTSLTTLANVEYTEISVNDLATKFFNNDNVEEKEKKPVISLSNTEILESISGVRIGTLSSGNKIGTYSLQNSNSALKIINEELYLADGYLLDHESGKVFNNNSGSWVDASWNKNITINFTSNNFHGDTVKSVNNIINNSFNSFVKDTINLSASSMKEGQFGVKIGTLSFGNLNGTFSLDNANSYSNNYHDYFEIKGNDLYIKEGYFFDYEGHAPSFSGSLSHSSLGVQWNNTILARFTPDDGSAVIDQALSISITDVDETITVSPQTVYKNVFGATIGTIEFNQNDFSRTIVFPNAFFEQSEVFEQTFKAGNEFAVMKAPQIVGSLLEADFTNKDGSKINGSIQIRQLDNLGNWGTASKIVDKTKLNEDEIYRIEDADGKFISEITGGGHRYVVDPDGTIYKYVNKGNQLKLKDNYKFDGTSFIDTDGNTTALADLVNGKSFTVDKSASSSIDPNYSSDSFWYSDGYYKIDGSNDPTLTLLRGKTYTFDMSGSGHPFYLKTYPTTGTSGEYTKGVVRKGSSDSSKDGDSLVFTVPYDAPDRLFYQCSEHFFMIGSIDIYDPDIRIGVHGGKTGWVSGQYNPSLAYGDTLITFSNLSNNFFKAGNTDVASNEPVIKINNTTILEAISGVSIGTLSAGDKTGTFSLTNSENYLTIIGDELKLKDGFILDYESGKIFDGRSGSWDPSSPISWNNDISITFTEADGTVTTEIIKTISVNLDESVNVSPVPLILNKYGATFALLSTNSIHLNDIILGYQNKNDYFEIVGNKLKLKDAYSYDGSVIKDSSGKSYSTKELPSVKVSINGGITLQEDNSTTVQETFVTSIFDLNEALSIYPKFFFTNHYGEAIADVIPNATNYFNGATLGSNTFFEYVNGQIKFKADYKFNGKKIEDKKGVEYEINHINALTLTPSGAVVTSDSITNNVTSINKVITPSDLKNKYLNDHNSLEAITSPFSTVLGDGKTDNRIDVVFLGDGYLASDLDYIQPYDIYDLINYLLTEQVDTFKAYKNYFNFHVIKLISNESGITNPSEDKYVDTALNLTTDDFTANGNPDRQLIQEVLNNGLSGTSYEVDQPVAISNNGYYLGGVAYAAILLSNDKVVPLVINSLSGETLAHEFGHSIGNNADTYINSYLGKSFSSDGINYTASEPDQPNVTKDPSGQKWAHWLGYDDGVLGPVSAYEGGHYISKGIYRPTYDS